MQIFTSAAIARHPLHAMADSNPPVGGAGTTDAVDTAAASASAADPVVPAPEEEADGYVAPAKVDLATIVKADAADESLQKYKASLLGSAAANPSAVSEDKETRRVVIHEMRIEVEGRPPIVFAVDTPAAISALEATKLQVKEGTSYVICIVFSVHQDVVLGLRFHNTVYGSMGIPLDRTNQMLGSYPPDGKRNEFRLPPGEWPSGMLARGNYSARAKFTDDDNNTHLEFNWSFNIAKTWPDGS